MDFGVKERKCERAGGWEVGAEPIVFELAQATVYSTLRREAFVN